MKRMKFKDADLRSFTLEGYRRRDLSGAPYSFHLVDAQGEQIIIVDDTEDLADRVVKALTSLNGTKK